MFVVMNWGAISTVFRCKRQSFIECVALSFQNARNNADTNENEDGQDIYH